MGGANASGKTTAALQILAYFLEVFEYVNADEPQIWNRITTRE
ncbi:hypothetical protein [Nostoc sp.]